MSINPMDDLAGFIDTYADDVTGLRDEEVLRAVAAALRERDTAVADAERNASMATEYAGKAIEYKQEKEAAEDERDAAVARADRLTDAIGDADQVLEWVREANSIMLRKRAVEIVNALRAVSPPPATTCPTCGSDNPDIEGYDDTDSCPDPWHQS